MRIETFISPNQNERANKQTPSLIILHYTGTKTMTEAHEIYMTDGKVSPHYMIDKDGSIRAYVTEENRAWHAGKSYWKGDTDINSSSIGIEIVNSGHEYELEEFPEIQIQSLIELLHGIIARWDIKPQSILGHSDIAIGRKIDPGEKFPWEVLEAETIGLLPQGGQFNSNKSTFDLLREWGYDYTQPIEHLKREFCRHYLRHHEFETITNEKINSSISSLLHQSQ
jgi:N-acetylmuramoyl-L-alanine amidase